MMVIQNSHFRYSYIFSLFIWCDIVVIFTNMQTERERERDREREMSTGVRNLGFFLEMLISW